MLNDLSVCQRLRVLKWPQKESYFIYSCFVFFFSQKQNKRSRLLQSIKIYFIFIHIQEKYDGRLLRLKDRCDARQHWIANILKVITYTCGGSSGYLTWRLMKKKILPPLRLQVFHSSCSTISQFHSVLPDICTIMFAVFIIPVTNTYLTPLTDAKQHGICMFWQTRKEQCTDLYTDMWLFILLNS